MALDELYDKLIEYCGDKDYPMHMPGHKRNTGLCRMDNPYGIDITEIEGFDNLHQPEGVLRSLAVRMSRLYGAKYSYPLVNGSTAGLLAGISAAVKRGDKVLLSRNCHKAVYHGVILMGLIPVYCYPQKMEKITPVGGILPADLEEALITYEGIRLVIITSPTYEGVVSDIGAIAKIAHRYGAYLMVDEAHGAHFGFSGGFPQSAVRLGADLVIQSLHKTLPAFTQTAVLHSNVPALDFRLRKYLAVYQSSSPSYILMAGMDQCIGLLEEKADDLFEAYERRLTSFYRETEKLKRLTLLRPEIIGKYGVYDLDRSKLTISVKGTGLNGPKLHRLLREKYHIMLEMEAPDYVLAMTSICDTDEGFDRLAQALARIDESIDEFIDKSIDGSVDGSIDRSVGERPAEDGFLSRRNLAREHQGPCHSETGRRELGELRPEIRLLPCEAWEKAAVTLEFGASEGRISAAFLSLFPPGAPVLVPGEVITRQLIDEILAVKEQGVSVTGFTGEDADRIEVVE